MKYNDLLFITFFLMSATFIIHNFYLTGKPEIKVEQNCVLPALKGDLVSYTFYIKSDEALKSINITPSIQGSNEDCVVEYSFDEQTKMVKVDYFYSLPENLSKVNSITLTVKISDLNTTVQMAEVIPVYNPPLMAEMLNDNELLASL